MEKLILITRKIVGIVKIVSLGIFLAISIGGGRDIDISFIFSVTLCLLFSIFLLKDEGYKKEERNEFTKKKRNRIYLLLFTSLYLSVLEIYMYYEELVLDRGSIACVIAAIGTYTLFDSIQKYISQGNGH